MSRDEALRAPYREFVTALAETDAATGKASQATRRLMAAIAAATGGKA